MITFYNKPLSESSRLLSSSLTHFSRVYFTNKLIILSVDVTKYTHVCYRICYNYHLLDPSVLDIINYTTPTCSQIDYFSVQKTGFDRLHLWYNYIIIKYVGSSLHKQHFCQKYHQSEEAWTKNTRHNVKYFSYIIFKFVGVLVECLTRISEMLSSSLLKEHFLQSHWSPIGNLRLR